MWREEEGGAEVGNAGTDHQRPIRMLTFDAMYVCTLFYFKDRYRSRYLSPSIPAGMEIRFLEGLD